MEQPTIDWDVIVYDYDPETRRISVANWLAGEEPLEVATGAATTDILLTPYIETFTRRLVDLANEKLAADQLAAATEHGTK